MPHRAEHTRGWIRTAVAFGARRKTPGRVPRQQPPTRIAQSYGRALAAYLRERIRAAYAPLLEALPALLEGARRERALMLDARTDAGESRRARELAEQARARLEASVRQLDVEALARRAAEQASAFNAAQLGRQVRSALGIDVVAQDRALPGLLDAYVDANVGLIKNITGKLAADTEAAVLAAVGRGEQWSTLAADLEKRLGYPERRAALIARDQVGKFYGQVDAARQRDLGVTHFTWRTSGDERVRDEHADRDGQRYAYADPPDGELPGEPILCRCSAEPDFSALLE